MAESTRLGRPARAAEPRVVTGTDWLLDHKVRVAGILMVAAQVWWMATFLSRSFFRLDDFYFLERALSSGPTWNYLMWVNAGHLTPVGFAISWVLVRVSPMDWTLASAVTLVLLAWAGLALLRLLRTLFGDHPGILVLLLIYLISPLSFPGLSWWSVTLEILPLEIAMFSALNSHIRYLRSPGIRQAVTTALWLLLGMAASVKGAGVPVLLLAITSAWLVDGSWASALRQTLREHWRAWLLYAAVLGGYVAVYAVQARSPSQKPALPIPFSSVVLYVRELITNTFVPGILGGPWAWFGAASWAPGLAVHGEYAVSSPPADLVVIAWVVAAAIILFSIWQRPQAWRSWLIVLGWLVAIDSIPVLLGRSADLPVVLLEHETRYVMDAVGVLVICAGLCFLPQVQRAQEVPRARRMAGGQRAPAAVIAMATAILIGSVVSYHQYLTSTSSMLARTYFATARVALSQAQPPDVVLNEATPLYVTDGFLGPVASARNVLGPLRPGGEPLLPFVSRPDGTFDHLLTFNGWGQLVPVQILGVANVPISKSCFPAGRDGVVTVRLASAPAKPSELRFGYLSGASGQAEITYAGHTQAFSIRRSLHSGFLPVRGEGTTVTFSGVPGLCVGDAEVGQLAASTTAAGLPGQPVSS